MKSPFVAGLEISTLRDEDVDQLAAIEASLQAFPWTAGNFRDSIAGGHRIWVLHSGDIVFGFAVTLQVLDEAHLLNIGLARDLQGQGWGARLLRHAMEACRANGAVKMFLEVRPSNDKAVALYRHLDFRHVGTRKAYYPAHEGREDALVFAKELI